VCKPYSDKFLFTYLFNAKGDLTKCVERITQYTTIRAEKKYPPRISAASLNQKLLRSGYAYATEDVFDKEGRSMNYIIMRKYVVADSKPEDMIRLMFWMFERWIRVMPLSAFRRGCVFIEDISGIGRKNMGSTDGQKELMKVVTGTFPFRISAIYVVNPNFMFKGLIKIAKFFMKAKIMKRVYPVTSEALPGLVGGKEKIIKEFGGTLEFSYEAWLARIFEEEAKEEKDGIISTMTTGPGSATAVAAAAAGAGAGAGAGATTPASPSSLPSASAARLPTPSSPLAPVPVPAAAGVAAAGAATPAPAPAPAPSPAPAPAPAAAPAPAPAPAP